jgi:hypothetical protein
MQQEQRVTQVRLQSCKIVASNEEKIMSKFIRVISTAGILLTLVLSSCNFPSKSQPTEEPNAVFTQAALTVQAQLAQATAFSTPTLPPPPPTSTAMSLPTSVPATLPPPATATPICDQARFIKDVTIPDGTTFLPNTSFTKTWRLMNSGACTWSGYSLVFDTGDVMGGTSPIPIGTVNPGQEVDLSVTLTAPATNGSYRGYWRVRNTSGILLPVLSGYQNTSFFVDIKVGIFSSGFDFYTNAPSASWSSGAGNLTWGGPDNDSNGFAMYKTGQKVEGGTTPAKVLETYPQSVNNGVISGRFPAYTVVTGEHFTAEIGFLALSDGSCGTGNAIFQLNYREGGGSVTLLSSWTETCDGVLRPVNVDLTPIAGKNVEFILTVQANGSSAQDSAVWIKPQIALP